MLKMNGQCNSDFSNSQGWYKTHRSLFNKPIWKKSNCGQKVLINVLLGLANFDTNTWEWNGEPFTCKPGQLITSIESLVEISGATKQTVRSALIKFEKYGFLTNQSTKTGRLITIVNWDKYQGNNSEATHLPTKNQHSPNKVPTNLSTPNKNLRSKEIKNDNKKALSSSFKPEHKPKSNIAGSDKRIGYNLEDESLFYTCLVCDKMTKDCICKI